MSNSKKLHVYMKPKSSYIWSAFILFFTYKMFQIIWPYTSWEWDVDFLETKQWIIHLDHYRLSFYAHIFSSLFVLLSGAFLFSKKVLKKWPGVHRWIGKSYVGLLLLISAPTGMVMAFYANGGWAAQLSFLILCPLWWWFTFKGYQTARQLDFKAHKTWMIRSYALTLSAVSLRIYQLFMGQFFLMDPFVQYILVSWLSWTGNILLAEIWIRRKHLSLSFSNFGELLFFQKKLNDRL